MAVQRTLCIIKPDAVERGKAGAILARVQEEGFRVLAVRQVQLAQRHVEGFYAVHRERPFFASLTKFMSSGPVLVVALEREDAVKHWRDVMGATNPANAAEGTIRKNFAKNIERNAVHGSDAPETAAMEIPFFFSMSELL